LARLKGRLILDSPASGFENMAVDESLFENAKTDYNFPVTLRLYGWYPATLSIGRRQNMEAINKTLCHKKGIDIVKRFAGGVGVYHKDEITYSFITRLDKLKQPTPREWRKVFLSLLSKLGLEGDGKKTSSCDTSVATCFSSSMSDEPTVGGKKWVGSARRKSKNVFLQHGSILLRPQPVFLKELIKDSGKDNSTGLLELDETLEYEAIGKALIQSVEEVFNLSFE